MFNSGDWFGTQDISQTQAVVSKSIGKKAMVDKQAVIEDKNMRVEGQVFKDGQVQHVKAGLNHCTSRKVSDDAFRRHLNSHFYSLVQSRRFLITVGIGSISSAVLKFNLSVLSSRTS